MSKIFMGLSMALMLSACATKTITSVDQDRDFWKRYGGDFHDAQLKNCESNLAGILPQGTPREKIVQACHDKYHYQGQFAVFCADRVLSDYTINPANKATPSDFHKSLMPLACATRGEHPMLRFAPGYFDKIFADWEKTL